MFRTGRTALFTLLAVTTVVLTACDWTMFRAGPAHTGYNSADKSIGVDDVATLAESWELDSGFEGFSTPTVVKGVVYTGIVASDERLGAFDAAGIESCSGTPNLCQPLWTGSVPNAWAVPAVADGIVYMTGPGSVVAFDAAGIDGCSGTPTVCTPLWSTAVGGIDLVQSATVADGLVYVGVTGGVMALDATTGALAWKALTPAGTSGANPAVVGGVLYTGAGADLFAFDAVGVTNCSAYFKVCAPLWTGTGGGTHSPAVANGRVYAMNTNGLFAFDAAGTANCTGSPAVCDPLWQAPIATSSFSVPAVTETTVYATTDDGFLYAFDAAGVSRCSGSPTTCVPEWSANLSGGLFASAPAVANGIVYAGRGETLHAFDAQGSIGCSGTPTVCTPLWTASDSAALISGPVVADGGVFVGRFDGIHAYLLAG